MGSSAASVLAAASVFFASAAAASFMRLSTMKASALAPLPSARNGITGMPGRSAITSITAPDMPSALG
jgi:hypothetical protein